MDLVGVCVYMCMWGVCTRVCMYMHVGCVCVCVCACGMCVYSGTYCGHKEVPTESQLF